jgi:hypothetical protein
MTLLSRLFGKSIEDDPHQIAHGDCFPEGAELLRIANETIFYDRPDLQYRFDRSAPPLIPSDDVLPVVDEATELRNGGRPFSGGDSPAADEGVAARTAPHGGDTRPIRARSVASNPHQETDYERS